MGFWIVLFGILTIAVCVVAILIYRRKLFQQAYVCQEGDFLVKGKKEKFIVKKDDRFEFIIVDGQIVSVKDRLASSQAAQYGGATNG